jgi:hypothetical protein
MGTVVSKLTDYSLGAIGFVGAGVLVLMKPFFGSSEFDKAKVLLKNCENVEAEALLQTLVDKYPNNDAYRVALYRLPILM